MMMVIRRLKLTKPHHLHLSTTTKTKTTVSPPTPVDQNHLLRVCTILYQQQNSLDSRLHVSLSSCTFDLTHEFFLQVCNSFPYSWRPVYRFFLYTRSDPLFSHSSTSFNKMLDVISKSRNIDLFWEVLQDMAKRGLVNDKTFRIALKTLASVRELKKCVQFFRLMNDNGFEYSLDTLNIVLEILCKDKLVGEAKYVVLKLKEFIKPSEVTYGWLVMGFCEMGDLIEASKVWNLMVEEGLEPGVQVFEKMMETLFKNNRYDEAMKVFRTMRVMRKDDLSLSTYRLVIDWMCKKGKVMLANMVFDEMLKRGFQEDDSTLASLIDGLLARARVREAYKIARGISRPEIGVYHALIKGLLRLKKTSEATQVFREMIRRGCEPTMHTYIMLLQAHLGKRGRKGPDPVVNFDTIFVGGLVKAGKSLEATKYVERTLSGGVEVPRFDYNKFLHYYSTEEGVVMFEEVGKKLREVGLVDLADILRRYGEKMATRERRRDRPV
ncbi:putative pentatricopeptide repeat-containing protein [Tripterygium wilfordii]|uniref:Putative pentatricopeptide repeat-containing protein n=1 Tax=Tripterygium wilfordii TaxID=458696 RepID=A0A7J7DGD1_TRIWF|nr:putative pentatricopeptide repeat-containing protein At1g26500 [Tripterygium wilfordii]KAF5745430.1 putative pentatricopeptide repeat-containing protein [Tripterygium wilfordii]